MSEAPVTQEGGPKTLVVVPVYNHAGTLRDVVLKALSLGLAVLVVEDRSGTGC